MTDPRFAYLKQDAALSRAEAASLVPPSCECEYICLCQEDANG